MHKKTPKKPNLIANERSEAIPVASRLRNQNLF